MDAPRSQSSDASPERSALPQPDGTAQSDKTFARRNAGASSFWPLLLAVFVMLTFITIPPAPAEIDMNADPSLNAVLHYAHEHHWQFGRDIVYTYGPLGYLMFFYFWPHGVWLRMLVDLALGYTVAAGLCLVAWRLRPWWRWALLAVFLFGAANLEPRTDFVLDTGLLCWGLLCFLESGRRLVISAFIIATLAAFSALGKTSYLFTGGLSVILLSGAVFVRGYRRLGLAMPATFGAACLLGWLGAGQSLSQLGPFLIKSVALVQGYNQALGWEGLPVVRWSGYETGALALGLILLRSWTAFGGAGRAEGPTASSTPPAGSMATGAPIGPNAICWHRALLFLWLSLLAYTDWKHGYVREDFFHPAFFLAFAPVLALGLEVLPCRAIAPRWCGRVLAVACSVVALMALQGMFLPAITASLPQPIHTFCYNLRCLLHPVKYAERMNRVLDGLREQAQLPDFRRLIGRASVDFFGYNQAYVLFNDLNYRTAPVFQSYAACTDRLNRLNEEFYLSPAAPEYVMLTLAAVDRKFPPLENGRVLRDLLFNYELAGTEQRFLLLRKKTAAAPQLSLLREGFVRPGQAIDVTADAPTNLWLEIHLEPTWAGRVRQILYRAPTVRLAVWQQPGKGLLDRHRAPPASLAAGFVASPLLVKTKDLQDLYEGSPVTRPGAFSLELLPGQEHWWHQTIRYRLYQIENRLGKQP